MKTVGPEHKILATKHISSNNIPVAFYRMLKRSNIIQIILIRQK